jgi:hypothetical protein
VKCSCVCGLLIIDKFLLLVSSLSSEVEHALRKLPLSKSFNFAYRPTYLIDIFCFNLLCPFLPAITASAAISSPQQVPKPQEGVVCGLR